MTYLIVYLICLIPAAMFAVPVSMVVFTEISIAEFTDDPDAAKVALVALAAVLWPVTVVVLALVLVYGTYRGARVIGRGLRELWRAVRPVRVPRNTIPRAVVHASKELDQ